MIRVIRAAGIGQIDKRSSCRVGGGRRDGVVVKEIDGCCWMEGHVHGDARTDGALWLWVVELWLLVVVVVELVVVVVGVYIWVILRCSVCLFVCFCLFVEDNNIRKRGGESKQKVVSVVD